MDCFEANLTWLDFNKDIVKKNKMLISIRLLMIYDVNGEVFVTDTYNIHL